MEAMDEKIRKLYLKRLKTIAEETDIEDGHIEADQILVDILDMLGYRDITDAYNNIKKWYS